MSSSAITINSDNYPDDIWSILQSKKRKRRRQIQEPVNIHVPKLSSYSGLKENLNLMVTLPGEILLTNEWKGRHDEGIDFISGHGTYTENGEPLSVHFDYQNDAEYAVTNLKTSMDLESSSEEEEEENSSLEEGEIITTPKPKRKKLSGASSNIDKNNKSGTDEKNLQQHRYEIGMEYKTDSNNNQKLAEVDLHLISCICGSVQRTSKLVTIHPPKGRYTGEIGDLVVGRIVEINAARWKVDIHGARDGLLSLSSIILPDGVQRIRNYEDQLQMRNFYVEGDIICAEIHKKHADGSIHLHTRTVRYGKLENGVYIQVSSFLIRRSKQHYLRLPIGLDVILGCNGGIWISRTLNVDIENITTSTIGTDGHNTMMAKINDNASNIDIDQADALSKAKERHQQETTLPDERLKIARVRGCIFFLNICNIEISYENIMEVYNMSSEINMTVRDLSTRAGQKLLLKLLVGNDENDMHEYEDI